MIEFFEVIFLSLDAFFDSLLVSYGVAGLMAALASLLWVRRLVRKMLLPVDKKARNPRRLQWVASLSAIIAFVPALYAGLIGGTFFAAIAVNVDVNGWAAFVIGTCMTTTLSTVLPTYLIVTLFVRPIPMDAAR